MKVRDLLTQLQALPPDADVEQALQLPPEQLGDLATRADLAALRQALGDEQARLGRGLRLATGLLLVVVVLLLALLLVVRPAP